MLSKAFEAKCKPILPSIISSNQTAYEEKRCISESGRLISDITEICGNENIPKLFIYLTVPNSILEEIQKIQKTFL